MKKCAKGGMFVPCTIHSFSLVTQNFSEEKKNVSRDETGMIIEKVGSINKERKKEKHIMLKNVFKNKSVRKYRL